MDLGVFNTDERFVWKKTAIWNCDGEFKIKQLIKQVNFAASTSSKWKMVNSWSSALVESMWDKRAF